MIIFLKLLIFTGSLIFFGVYFVRFVLKERNISTILALGPATGVVFYIFLLNATSYFIPIKINFYLIWAVLFISGVFFAYFEYRRKESVVVDIEKKWLRWALITATAMSLWAGLVAARGLFYDNLSASHVPTAAIISDGGFPVQNVVVPGESFKYHYAAELFSAAINRVTGISIWRAYDIQIILTVFFIFFIIFGLALYFSKNSRTAYLTAALVVYGGGLNYLHVFDGLINFYDKYIRGLEVDGFFSFLPRMINGEIVDPVIGTVNHHWTALGFFSLLGVIYIYVQLVDRSSLRKNIGLLILGSVFLSFLALSAETLLGIIIIVFLAHPVLLFFKSRGFSKEVWRCVFYGAAIILLAAPIILFQGGVLSVRGLGVDKTVFNSTSSDFVSPTIALIPFGKDPSQIPYSVEGGWSEEYSMNIFSYSFVKNFGLGLILFIPGIIFLKKRFKYLEMFILLALIPLCMPIFVYYTWPHEMLRFFFPAMLFFNFILGLYLGWLLMEFENKKYIYRLVCLVVALVILPGLIFEAAYTIVPLKKIENIPHEFYYVKDFFSKDRQYSHEFFSQIPDPEKIDRSAFAWIDGNTTIKDVFFYPIGNPVYYDIAFDFTKLKFIVFSRRLSPDYGYRPDVGSWSLPDMPNYIRATKTCSLDLLRDLGFNYMYVSPLWPVGLEQKCLNTGKILKVFETTDGADFRRIYKINY